jgi:CRP-like cAMP-binding protein
MEKGGMRGIEGAKQTRRLVSKLVPAMSDTSRGAALTAILSGLSSEQKASAIGDAFETLATGTSDIIAVLKEVIEALNADDRAKLLQSALKETSSDERVAILSSLLERISPNELARSLSTRAQNVSLLSAMPQEMLANILKELPLVADGSQLASMLPPALLQTWGSKLLGAAPEDVCKAWLTQLLTAQSKTSTNHASFSQLLVESLGPDVFAFAYANLGMNERLRMLSAINELKQQGAVSPAPFSKREVEHLISILNLAPSASSPVSSTSGSPFGSPTSGNHLAHRRGGVGGAFNNISGNLLQQRRGSVLFPLPGGAPGLIAGATRVREKVQVIPLDQTIRTIADIYQKKVKDDQLADLKTRMRCPMTKFTRNYLLRQYGMKSVAEKAMRELIATVRAYSLGGEQSIVRIRMFGEMNGLLKNEYGLLMPPWCDRKTDFFLFVLVRLALSAKDGEKPPVDSPPTIKSLAALSAGDRGRRGSIQPVRSNRSNNQNTILWSTAPISGIKEVLCREQVTISLAAAQSMIEVAVLDRTVSADAMCRVERLAEDRPSTSEQVSCGVVHFDDLLEVMMAVWDEQEKIQAPRVDEHLRKTFMGLADANGRMSFTDFESFCTTISNQSLEEDRILDMFDDAIRETEVATGEETDTISLEGFARIARFHNLISFKSLSCLVDAVSLGRSEAPKARDRDGTESEASSFSRTTGSDSVRRGPESRGSSSRRTVIKTSSSKTNDRNSGQDRRHALLQKPERVHNVIWSAVQSHFLFRHLSADMHRELVQRMVPVPAMPGQDIIKQGDKGDYFYVAESGAFDVIVNDEKVHTYQAGDGIYPCFGELALLYAKPRAATIRASGPGMLWGLDRKGFRSVQMFSSNIDLMKLLRKMDILSSLPFNSLQTLMNHMVEQSFGGGEFVFHEGDDGDSMYVILCGTAVVTKAKAAVHSRTQLVDGQDHEEGEEEMMQLEAEMYFGERALLDNAPRAASVQSLTPLKCMKIERATFERLLGPLQQIIDADRQRREWEAAAQLMQLEAAGLSGASLSSFKLQAALMRLDTGGLLAALHIGSNEIYTVRAESKSKIAELEQTDRVSRELEVMRAAGLHGHTPMLPAMLCTFASPLALFALFKTRVACELSHIIEVMGGKVPTESARYVGACVIAALERLHCKMGVVYRNLSPDALAIDENGVVCLMDLRQAKILSGNKTFTLCGVADYLAPEQVTCSGHGLSVDFWGLGVLLWTITAGEGPWGNDPNEMNVYKRITDHVSGALSARLQAERERGFLPPDGFVPSFVDLVDRLIVPDPLARLGASAVTSAGFDELKAHAWLGRMHWGQLIEGLVPSPLISSASTHVREQLAAQGHRTSDAVVTEVVGTTEYRGDMAWFATAY